ncbi:MAG: hypothetical protein II354_01285, partial [Firmicutes bacterium]|nr:hypothetical protein [Bacillota bacterium]
NENFVTEEVTENVETTTEEIPVKTYTQEEVNEMMGKRLARKEAKIRKEYEKKYGTLEEVLKAGTGKESVEELTDTFADFYEKKGIQIKKEPKYSEREAEVLARAEAADIIDAGYEEVVEEVERLAKIGFANMSSRDKVLFKALADHRANAERANELSKLGVTADVYNSSEFKDFASKFNPSTSISDIYDIYNKTKPKKEFRTMGSMKQGQNTGVKDYYTPEEIERLTEEDLDDPVVWENVRRSMTGG